MLSKLSSFISLTREVRIRITARTISARGLMFLWCLGANIIDLLKFTAWTWALVHAKDHIEKYQRCFRLGSYFMAAVWAAASYSRWGFSLCRAGNARRVMVPGGSKFHMEPGTIHHCFLYALSSSCEFHYVCFVIEGGGGDVYCWNPPSLNSRLPSDIETGLEFPCIRTSGGGGPSS